MVAIFTAPINLLVDYLFVDVLSAPTLDEVKLKRQHEMKQSKLNQMVKKAGDSVRRASAVTVDAIKVARKQFGGQSHHVSLQIPETTMEAHTLAKLSSRMFVQEQKVILEKQLSSRNTTRSESLVARHQRSVTRNYALNNRERRTMDRAKHNDNNSRGEDAKSQQLRLREEVEELAHLFGEFMVDLNEQRRALKPSTRDRYDSQWGVDPTGEFSKQWSASWSGVGLSSAENALRNEMKLVRSETKRKVEKLHLATDSQIGLEMLHMFVMDVLGRDTPAAKIFLTKSQIE